MTELMEAAIACWCLSLLFALGGRALRLAKGIVAVGAFAAAASAMLAMPGPATGVHLPLSLGDSKIAFRLDAEGAWLALFGFFAAAIACLLGTPSRGTRGWVAGAALAMLGALGVFGLRDGISFLIAWETMSFGGACMLLSERLNKSEAADSMLFMLGLLEVGAVALIVAFLMLAHAAGSFDFERFHAAAMSLSPGLRFVVGLLILVGFGAKLGLLPFYEWFPGAYGNGSGASGVLLSGVILNAAYFGLARGLGLWLPAGFGLGAVVVAVAVVSAILSILYAFQEEDWRELLAFSTAENAGIAVASLGASILFNSQGLHALAALAWSVALLHLAGHTLAKGAMFLGADGVYHALGVYRISQSGLLKRSPWLFGVGIVFGGMSLAAMPPQAGFVSEWFTFQTVFQGFHMPSLAGRLVLALAGVGLALTAAIALATFVKLVGIGGQGRSDDEAAPVARRYALASGGLGIGSLALAVGMPWWLQALSPGVAAHFGAQGPGSMHEGVLLVPLTSGFAFISPTKLIIVCPLLALLPLALLWFTGRRHSVRRARVWYGGFRPDSPRVATTALTFSNAMRVFYSFVYRPTLDVAHEHHEREYFVHRLHFDHAVAPVFGPLLFRPLTRAVQRMADRLRPIQSGHMNLYLSLVGVLLLLALIAATL